MKTLEKQCLDVEMEYREWRECPMWYCVKTVLHDSGKIECEIMADEKTKMPIAIQSFEKPMDGVFEVYGKTTYYSYQQGYAEAAKQLELARM